VATRIVTLTLNPAIDLACETDSVQPTLKVRTTTEQFDPGGGGINVARVVNELGGESLAVLMAGGATGRFLRELLDREGVACRTVPVAGLTRIGVTIHDRSSGLEYRFVPEGPQVSEAEWRGLLEALSDLEADWLVGSGSLPRGVPEDFYARIAALALRRGQHFVLDSSGSPLKAALGKGITLVKPSLRELEGLLGRAVADPLEQDAEAVRLAREGAARLVVISLGAGGAVLANADGSLLRLPAPTVPVRSAVGAGDSFVAAMTLALARGLPAEDALAWGIAAGSAAVMHYGTAHPRRADVESLYSQISAGRRSAVRS
jgi:6-phosphofructokinase 2